jgi:hypothetical protein
MSKKLYITPCPNFSVKTVQDLIESLFKEPSTLKKRKYARPTYKDKACTKVECSAGRRSFEDMLVLARTRFPNTTEKCLMKALKELKLKFYYCHQIHKAIFHYVGGYGYTLAKDNFHKLPPGPYEKETYTPSKLSEIYLQI